MSNDHFFNILSIFFRLHRSSQLMKIFPWHQSSLKFSQIAELWKFVAVFQKGMFCLMLGMFTKGVTYFVFIQVGYTHDASKHAYICNVSQHHNLFRVLNNAGGTWPAARRKWLTIQEVLPRVLRAFSCTEKLFLKCRGSEMQFYLFFWRCMLQN